MSGRITDLMLAGMGQLGGAIGQGVEGYLTERDLNALQAAPRQQSFEGPPPAAGPSQGGVDFQSILRKYMEAGVPPEKAFEEVVTQLRGGGAPSGPALPGVRQPAVVGQTVGPMESPFGQLSAGPPPLPVMPPPEATVGETSPGLEAAFAAGDSSRSTPRSPGTIPQNQSAMVVARAPGRPEGAPLPYAERPAQRIQRVSGPVQSPAPQGPLASMGVSGRITPRNAALAQFMVQQQAARDAAQRAGTVRESQVDLRERQLQQQGEIAAVKAALEAQKEAGRNTRNTENVEGRLTTTTMQEETKRQLGEVRNSTDVMRIKAGFKARMAEIYQRAQAVKDTLGAKKDTQKEGVKLLGVLGDQVDKLKRAAEESGEPKDIEDADRAKAIYDEFLDEVFGMSATGGGIEVTEKPGRFFGTTRTETRKPAQGKVSAGESAYDKLQQRKGK